MCAAGHTIIIIKIIIIIIIIIGLALRSAALIRVATDPRGLVIGYYLQGIYRMFIGYLYEVYRYGEFHLRIVVEKNQTGCGARARARGRGGCVRATARALRAA